MKTTLLIMAVGIGSRFGTGIKQLEPVDDAGHIIMDYLIHRERDHDGAVHQYGYIDISRKSRQ